MFGVPLFAWPVLAAVFSHPVIRGLGVVVVDADRSDTSRMFVERVAASPSLSIVERTGDLASAARAIRAGDAIAAVYIPADFERDLKAGRRPQVVAFYNQQFLTAAGVASSGLSDSLAAAVDSAASAARGAPQASRIGSLVAETIVLANPERNYAQFLLRAQCCRCAVRGRAVRAGGARVAALRLRAPLRRAGDARRALHAARVPAPTRDRNKHVPYSAGSGAGSSSRPAARRWWSLCCRVAARARHPRSIYTACSGALGLRLVLHVDISHHM